MYLRPLHVCTILGGNQKQCLPSSAESTAHEEDISARSYEQHYQRPRTVHALDTCQLYVARGGRPGYQS